VNVSTTKQFLLRDFQNMPKQILNTPLEGRKPFGSKHCSCRIHTVARKTLPILLPVGEVGREQLPKVFGWGRGGEREREKSAPWRQKLPCVFSHTDAKDRPCTGYKGEQWFAWSRKVYRRRVVNAQLISFLPSLSWFFMWKFLQIPGCFKGRQFYK
jgi:hypothetical protein